MTGTLIDDLLEKQRDLTAVGIFARTHGTAGHALAGFYRDLVPLSKPGAGEQYAFEVDLDKCTGCKACVAACHSLNGLDEEETWREVGVLVGGTAGHPRTQTVTSACHHCAEPGCLEGCPVLAYEKDPETGVVRHLDDQCIGCSYCILKCPYEVPKFSKTLGVVRKCDMCHSRLAVGEAPACVQSCPTSAIAIRIVKVADARQRAANEIFLPGSPDPRITIPTTTYLTRRPLSERAVAGDHYRPTVQHAHLPLAVMLALTQAAAGYFTAAAFGRGGPAVAIAGAVLLLAGLVASTTHLGQPLKAWRAFLGWRTSWLSREIMVFGAFAGAAVPAALLTLWLPELAPPALAAACALGWISVTCSGYVYHDTGRAVWRGVFSLGRFFLTTLLFALLAAGLDDWLRVLLLFRMVMETGLAMRGHGSPGPLDDFGRAGRLLRGPLRGWLLVRWLLGALVLVALSQPWPLPLALLIAAELVERSLFFRAGVATRMPGL